MLEGETIFIESHRFFKTHKSTSSPFSRESHLIVNAIFEMLLETFYVNGFLADRADVALDRLADLLISFDDFVNLQLVCHIRFPILVRNIAVGTHVTTIG